MTTTKYMSMEVRKRKKKKFLGTIPETNEEQTLISKAPNAATNVIIEDSNDLKFSKNSNISIDLTNCDAIAESANSARPPVIRFLSKFALAFSTTIAATNNYSSDLVEEFVLKNKVDPTNEELTSVNPLFDESSDSGADLNNSSDTLEEQNTEFLIEQNDFPKTKPITPDSNTKDFLNPRKIFIEDLIDLRSQSLQTSHKYIASESCDAALSAEYVKEVNPPEKPTRQLFYPFVSDFIENIQAQTENALNIKLQNKVKLEDKLNQNEIEEKKHEAQKSLHLAVLQPLVASKIFKPRNSQQMASSTSENTALIDEPLNRIGASRRRQFKTYSKVSLQPHQQHASCDSWTKEITNATTIRQVLPRVSKSLPRRSYTYDYDQFEDDSERGRTIKKCIISLRTPNNSNNDKLTRFQTEHLNSKIAGEIQQQREVDADTSLEVRNAARQIAAKHNSERTPTTSASLVEEMRSIDSSSSGCVSATSSLSLASEPTTFYRRRRQALQQIKRARKQRDDGTPTKFSNNFCASEECDREISVISRSFSLPESLQSVATILQVCTTQTDSEEKLTSANETVASSGCTNSNYSEASEEDESGFTDSGIGNTRYRRTSRNAELSATTKVNAQPILAKTDIFEARRNLPPYRTDNAELNQLIGQLRSQNNDEINKLSYFASDLNREDINNNKNDNNNKYNNKNNDYNIEKAKVVAKKQRNFSDEKLQFNNKNNETKSFVCVNVEAFREQCANISASCTIPAAQPRERTTEGQEIWSEMRFLPNADNNNNNIFNTYNHNNNKTNSAKTNGILQSANESSKNAYVRHLKSVDIPLDLPYDDNNRQENETLTHTVKTEMVKRDENTANDSFETLSLRLSLQNLQEESAPRNNRITANMSNFGNSNAFGFTIAGAGAAMSRAEQPTVSVESVGDGSSAQRAGLKVGDLLLEINGSPTAGKYFYSIRRMLNETVTKVIVNNNANQADYGVLNLVVRRPILHDIKYFHLSNQPAGNNATTPKATDDERNTIHCASSLWKQNLNSFTVSSSPLSSSFNHTTNSSNKSSGIRSSASPSHKTNEAQTFQAQKKRQNGFCNSESLSAAVAAGEQRNSGGEYNSPNGDYRFIAMDSRPTPGRLDDFIPEVERSDIGGTLKAPRAQNASQANARPEEDAYSRRFHSLDARRRVSVTPDTSEARLIRNYDLHFPDDAAYDANEPQKNTVNETAKSARAETDPREWREFVAEQRTPAPGNMASLNRIQADSRMQIIYRSGKEVDGKSPRPIIKSLSRPSEYDERNKKEASETKANGVQPPIMTVSGSHRCAHCDLPLGRGAAMIVEALSLFYHLSCFRCNVCSMALGNGTRGADVRVRGHRLHCQKCFSADEYNLRLSRV